MKYSNAQHLLTGFTRCNIWLCRCDHLFQHCDHILHARPFSRVLRPAACDQCSQLLRHIGGDGHAVPALDTFAHIRVVGIAVRRLQIRIRTAAEREQTCRVAISYSNTPKLYVSHASVNVAPNLNISGAVQRREVATLAVVVVFVSVRALANPKLQQSSSQRRTTTKHLLAQFGAPIRAD